MSKRLRAGIAGVVGAVVALGMAELLHGLFDPVPSVFTSLAQGVVRLTPGVLVTKVIETLGTANIPTSVTIMIVGALVVAALLANLALRSPTVAPTLIGMLGVIVIGATLAEPFVAPIPTVLTVAGAL